VEEKQYKDLYINSRPKRLDDVYGQDLVVKALKKEQKSKSHSKATFFQAPSGLGKTTLAKIKAMSIACKNLNDEGEPCSNCPTCKAIIDENWDRDVMYINGTNMSAEDVRKVLDGFKQTAAFRDAAKVLIIDETQDLSPEAINTLLQVTESNRKGQYYILTAMDKLKGKLAIALESRCKKWKLKVPSVQELYLYLVKMVKDHNFMKEFTDQKVFDTFMKEGLETIAQNCDYSYRMAIQMLEQCISGALYTKEDIKKTLDLNTYEDMNIMMIDLANGKITPTVISTITGKEYQSSFGLISKIIGDAAVIKACGTLGFSDDEKWKEKGPRDLANAPFFTEIRDAMISITKSQNGYLQRGLWEMEMSKLVEIVSKNGITSSSPAQARRRPVS
jgi:DNA polymerase-3 subunit gamma/tau